MIDGTSVEVNNPYTEYFLARKVQTGEDLWARSLAIGHQRRDYGFGYFGRVQ